MMIKILPVAVLAGALGVLGSGCSDDNNSSSSSTGSGTGGHGGGAAGPGSTSSSGTGGAGTTSSGTGGGSGGHGGSSGAGGGVQAAPGYFHTQGSRIVDSKGNPIRLTGINWFGLETSNYAPHGLWSRSMDDLLDVIKTLGYNIIRLPFCSQMLDPGSTPNGIDMNKNPDLQGLNGLQIMDKVIEKAGKRGLRVFLDRHRPDSGAQSALWYTAAYSEQRWIDDWKMLAAHYKGNPTVVGVDLHNEPHAPATWGSGDPTNDWSIAATKAGDAVLDVNPDLLIIVEGVDAAESTNYWWGGNLKGAKTHPITLKVPDHLVYSTHDYPASVFAQTWFSDPTYPSNLPSVWDDRWGYLVKAGTAPVLIGEFGTKYETDVDKKWLGKLAEYISQNKLSFTYWCLNPDSGDTGGILQDDWMTINQAKQDILKPLLAPPL